MLKEDELLVQINWSYGLTGAKEWSAGFFWLAMKETINAETVEYTIRRVIKEWYATNPSADTNYPNWGDAMQEVSDEHWEKHGFRVLVKPTASACFCVDHDETVR